MADLTVADAYDPAAPVTVTGRVDALDVSSGSYGSVAWWAFTVTLLSSNGTRLSVDTRFPFSAGYAAWEGCSQTAAALLPAVQDLIGKLIGHPAFTALVR